MTTPAIYYIIYPPGSCGMFISLILAQMMWPKLARIEEFKDRGHADHVTLKYIENLQIVNFMTEAASTFVDNPYFIKDTGKLSLIERIKYLPNKKKFIFIEHYFPDVNKVYARYPNTKLLIIGYNKHMAVRLHANRYYKTTDSSHSKLKHTIYNERERWGVKEWAEKQSEFDTNHIAYSMPSLFPDLESKIYRIDLYRIIHDHVNLLEDLSKWCGYTIVPECLPTYENYLKAQNELLPWLDDRLT